MPVFALAQTAPVGVGITGQVSAEATSTAALGAGSQGVGTGLHGTLTYAGVSVEYTTVSVGGTSGILVEIRDCTTDSTYTTCTLVATTTRQSVTVTHAGQQETVYGIVNTNTGVGLLLDSTHYYKWTVDETATYTGSAHLVGTVGTPVYVPRIPNGQAIVGTAGGLQAFEYDWVQTFTINLATHTIAEATSSSLFSSEDATATLTALDGQCAQIGNLLGEGLCIAGVFLFVPATAVLDDFFNIPAVAGQRFPFSWIFAVKDEFQSLSVSSTTAMTTLSFNLTSLGIGSTTSMGNILPNAEVFSRNTIETYISPTLWATFQTLIAAGMWLGFFWFEFNRARRMAKPHV